MSGATPRIVVFDIGNVLVRWDMRNLFAKVIDDADRLDWFLANVCTMRWHGGLDAGATYAEVIGDLSARFPEHAETIALYDARWQETIAGAIEGSVEILERLRGAGVPVTRSRTFQPRSSMKRACGFLFSPISRG